MKKLILIGFLIFQYSITHAASNDIKQQTQNFVDQWRVANNVPGMVVTVLKPKLCSFTVTSGSVGLNISKSATSNDGFQIGSITKTFTSAEILKLEAEGKLSINDRIGKWFPEFPKWQNITIKQLLNMSSGIFQYEQDEKFSRINQTNHDKQWSPEELVTISYQHPLYFQPGASWHYSNANYILAGLIIEKITGKPLADAFNANFLKPLNLQNTYFISGSYHKKYGQQMARGYQDSINVTNYNMSTFGAAGAMVSTSQNIATWVNALFTGTVIPQAQLQEFMTTISFNAPPKPAGSRYGLGVYYLSSKEFGDIWWYSGVTNGYISLFMYLPKNQTIITATIDRIQNKNYWLLMPDHLFAKQMLMLVERNVKQ